MRHFTQLCLALSAPTIIIIIAIISNDNVNENENVKTNCPFYLAHLHWMWFVWLEALVGLGQSVPSNWIIWWFGDNRKWWVQTNVRDDSQHCHTFVFRYDKTLSEINYRTLYVDIHRLNQLICLICRNECETYSQASAVMCLSQFLPFPPFPYLPQ